MERELAGGDSHLDPSARCAFLARASALLEEPLGYEASVAAVAQLAVPLLADACAVDLLNPDDGRPVRLVSVPAGQIGPSRGGSLVTLPLKLGTRVLGALLLQAVSPRLALPRDLPFLENLAWLIASAIDHGRRLRAANEARAEAESRALDYRVICEVIPQQIWTATADGQLDYVNSRVVDYFERPAAQILGDGWQALVHSDDLPDCLKRWQHALATGEAYELEFRLRRGADAAYLWHLCRALPLRDRAGRIVRWVGAATDIDEKKRTEGEREKLLAVEHGARKAAQESERNYRLLAETMPQIVWAASPDGMIDYLNQRTCDFTGRSLEELLGAEWLNGIHPDDREATLANWMGVVRAEAPSYEAEFRIRRFDGLYRWHLSRAVPLRAEDGRVLRWLGTCTDIEDQKRTAARLNLLAGASSILASSLEYETTLAAVAKLAVPVLADWCLVDLVNEHGVLERMAVAHADPTQGKLAAAIKHQSPGMSAGSPVRRAFATCSPVLLPQFTVEMLHGPATSAERLAIVKAMGPRSCLAVPLVARGRTLGVVSHFFNACSGRRHSEEDLALATEVAQRMAIAVDNALLYRRAEEASRIKDDFLATISHELRTPLTAILGWLQLLRRGLSVERQAHALEVVERNALSQARIVEDLIDVSRILSGKLRLEVGPVDLGAAVEAALESIRPAAEAKGLQLSLRLQEGTILGDASRIQQMIWNLLTNAVKFTPSGGHIDVDARRDNGSIEISVRDDGAGIAPEFLPYVFERFRQAEASSNRRYGGLGLGLSIVRHLVELHGGSVSVDSMGIGRGSVFTVRLPLSQVARNPLRRVSGERVSAAPPTELVGKKVVVLEDEADVSELIAVELERCQAEVRCAASTPEALALVERELPDVIVADIGLPGEDGYSFIRRLRQLPQEEGGAIPAIALTAYARGEDRARALMAGFQMHLAKPAPLGELTAALASLLPHPAHH
jgi:PAS domain S-box-containing protein